MQQQEVRDENEKEVFKSFPVTTPPPPFVFDVVGVFRKHHSLCDTSTLKNDSPKSDGVLEIMCPDLLSLGFEVEQGKSADEKIHRPVLFGENGIQEVKYEIDAFHSGFSCGLEVEAGRAWKGNAVYRDLILASLMYDVDHFIIAVPNEYWFRVKGKSMMSKDYNNSTALADTIFAHDRIKLPYNLTIIGY